MTHFHEVYFNKHTSDGPRVGMTRRSKREIISERMRASFRWPGSEIVRCERPDERCPWTSEGVPGEAE